VNPFALILAASALSGDPTAVTSAPQPDPQTSSQASSQTAPAAAEAPTPPADPAAATSPPVEPPAAHSTDQPAPHVARRHAPGDPWEGLNRKTYRLNEKLDRYLFRPVAQTYRRLLPKFVRGGIHNALHNWEEPSVALNYALQWRWKQAGDSSYRFAVNSTFGLLGVLDMADRAGVPHTENGFAITMGRYGVGSGPYVYLPFGGPSSVRDLTGAGIDLFTNPLTLIRGLKTRLIEQSETALSIVDARVRVDDDLQNIAISATDPYASIRSIYLQRVEAQVSGDEFSLGDAPDIPGAPEPPMGAKTTPQPPSTDTPKPKP